MSRDADPKLTEIAQQIAVMRQHLGAQGTFRLRVLLEMIILELSGELQQHAEPLRPDSPDDI